MEKLMIIIGVLLVGVMCTITGLNVAAGGILVESTICGWMLIISIWTAITMFLTLFLPLRKN